MQEILSVVDNLLDMGNIPDGLCTLYIIYAVQKGTHSYTLLFDAVVWVTGNKSSWSLFILKEFPQRHPDNSEET